MTHDHSRSAGHVLIAGICQGDIALVREPYRPDPAWKLPGGTRDIEETPEEAARREFEEETGINIDEIPLFLLIQRTRTNRRTGEDFEQYLFATEIPPEKMRPLKEGIVPRSGDDGEDLEATAFALSAIETMGDFFYLHREVIKALT